ncbi:MAG: hypothetical protein F4065_07155 [Rhodothermaceae bacterium]|nr:hypothetical protein [Bacteroidota bacterium]MXW15224.1 hypothetical protein [Rhodothermaceae bacterium]MDE2646781.1 hypothetical protein [Bacteroidota bacterium]MXW33154.1 hypothetical protein [Rhodothermaceae bacterium]MXX97468.1 hypothetical protein [Rhodothermaceae bacterium]
MSDRRKFLYQVGAPAAVILSHSALIVEYIPAVLAQVTGVTYDVTNDERFWFTVQDTITSGHSQVNLWTTTV